MEWSREARAIVAEVAKTIPDDTPFKERKRIVRAAYPWGHAAHWPYKAWCKAQREYLARWNPAKPPATPLFPDLKRDPVTGRPVIA